MKIGLFFGSFNPIHIGHLIIANTMAEHLDRIWFVVSPQNPFKKNKSLLHEFDRLTMVEKAIQDNHKFAVSDVEFSMPRPSYTIDTLSYLAEKNPHHQFQLIIGSDNLKRFPQWKNYQQILDEYGLMVYPRPGKSADQFMDHPKVHYVEAPLLDISATYIRKCVKEGRSLRYLLPMSVAQYIDQQQFYL
ncbi:MAG: nicotinate (nicotinamide) nucleotide adenylyltransferase [Cyclobacteriaceae bacterium]|nr:nicotinate (nicotinamide) nucleotide adenylyltransferase [Cyclobacteriaceae bacterium]